ncbi:hypothetical protein [Variovorax sp. LT1R16]|uniref:hypothetical protein n=1 Tax=Variovorax sp. LT1R16 TaxID=3443728 RepID=UPI003F486F9C
MSETCMPSGRLNVSLKLFEISAWHAWLAAIGQNQTIITDSQRAARSNRLACSERTKATGTPIEFVFELGEDWPELRGWSFLTWHRRCCGYMRACDGLSGLTLSSSV